MTTSTHCYFSLLAVFALASIAATAESAAQQPANPTASTQSDASVRTLAPTQTTTVIAVRGVVQRTSSRWVDAAQMIVTDVTLKVQETSDLELSNTITFTAPGGELVERNLRMTINAIPIFRAGQLVTVSVDQAPLDANQSRNLPRDRYSYRYRTHLPNGVSKL